MAKQTKKVLFTSHVANFQKFNRPFMRMLSKQGYEVHYASMGEEEILDCDKSFTVPFTRSPFGLSNITAYKQLKAIIDREGYDIIHTHTPMGSVVTRLAARTARKKGTRVIYTAHGFHFFKGAPLINWLIYYPVERYMARHTDALVTINEEDYNIAKNKFKTDVKYIPGVGIDQKKFDFTMTKLQKTELRQSLDLKEDDFVIIYAAELSNRKNQLWLIPTLTDLVRKNGNIQLLLPGKDSLNGRCQRLLDKLSLGDNIHCLGYRDDMPKLYRISDLAVSPSLQEGQGIHLIEAMATGLSVVATRCRGHTDIIQHGKQGLLYDINNKKTFLEQILFFYNDKDAAKVIGKRNIAYAGRFSVESSVKEMASIYTNDVGGGNE